MKFRQSIYTTGLGLAAVALVAACVTQPGVVKVRASNDFPCGEEQIEVKNIGGTSYRAVGCGKEGTYSCVSNAGNGQITCMREEQKNRQ